MKHLTDHTLAPKTRGCKYWPVIEIREATGRFEDASSVLRPRENVERACWCLTYRLSPTALAGVSRPEAMRELCAHDPAPGLIAYSGGEPVGWCGVGPRAAYHRLVHSRTIQKVDELPAWSVVCFVVKAGHRGAGIASRLLEEAIEFARRSGAQAIEGYPVESQGGRVSASLAFPGSTNLFERAGFTRIAPTQSKTGGKTRWIVRLDLN